MSYDPSTIRTVKLLKYLLDGNSVNIDGDYYIYRIKDGCGASNAEAIEVNEYSIEEFAMLAEILEGKELVRVMNYRKKQQTKENL